MSPLARLFSWTLFAVLILIGGGAVAAEKTFAGVGLQVVPVDGGELVILKVVSGSSAATAGLSPGDLIIAVDGYDLKGSDFGEVVSKRLWGVAGSSVQLRYLRPGAAGERTATCKRLPLTGDVTPTEGIRLLAPDR